MVVLLSHMLGGLPGRVLIAIPHKLAVRFLNCCDQIIHGFSRSFRFGAGDGQGKTCNCDEQASFHWSILRPTASIGKWPRPRSLLRRSAGLAKLAGGIFPLEFDAMTYHELFGFMSPELAKRILDET